VTATSAADELLSGLRRCRATNTPVSPALLDMMIEFVVRASSHAQRKKLRNRLIIRASRLLPAGNTEAVAKALLRETRAMRRTWHILKNQSPCVAVPDVRALLHEAHLIEELPDCVRSFRRILLEGAELDTDRMALSAKSAR
jgi:hypothetical protein